jgi:site-specific recombinase XerC
MNGDYSADGLSQFFEYVAQKGLMNSETIRGRRVATQKILEILQDNEKLDLRKIDKDLVFQRFMNLRGRDYNPQSLAVYKSRFASALNDFFSWNEDPLGFRPAAGLKIKQAVVSKVGKAKAALPVKKAAQSTTELSVNPVKLDAPSTHKHTELIDLPIPLRPGVMVHVTGLPLDLSADEAKKISGIVSAYAMTADQ